LPPFPGTILVDPFGYFRYPEPIIASTNSKNEVGLRRTLGLWDLILYGVIVIQPTAPMSVFGVLSNRGRGHVVTTILIAMVAMRLLAHGLYPQGLWRSLRGESLRAAFRPRLAERLPGRSGAGDSRL